MGACCAQIKGFTLGLAPINGLWIKFFVKALPKTADRLTDKFLFIKENAAFLILAFPKYFVILRQMTATVQDVMLAVGYNDHKTFLL